MSNKVTIIDPMSGCQLAMLPIGTLFRYQNSHADNVYIKSEECAVALRTGKQFPIGESRVEVVKAVTLVTE